MKIVMLIILLIFVLEMHRFHAVKGSRNSDASGHLMQNVDLPTDQNFQHEEEHTMYHHHQDEEHNIDADDAHGVYNEMVVGDEDVQHPAPEITEV
jgi:hypothetical protein